MKQLMMDSVLTPLVVAGPQCFFLDGLDLEMEADEGEHETLEVLDQVVETAETVRVTGLVHVHQGPDLAGGEADVLVPDHDLQLLTTNTVGLGPEGVVLGHDLAVLDDSAELVHDGAVDIGLLPDHGVVLVVAVVGVPELAIRTKLKLEKLVTKFSLVSNIVTEVKIIGHGFGF